MKPFLTWLRQLLKQSTRAVGVGWRRLICALFNLRRRLFRKRLDSYVVITLSRELEERDPHEPWWYDFIPGRKPPQTIESLHHALQRIAVDPAVKGVLFLVKAPNLSLVQAQSLTALFNRFRQWDRQQNPHRDAKAVVIHLEQITLPLYVMACAADRIFVPPLTGWDVLGLRTTPTFFKSTLAKLGVEMDVHQIAPWKSALDSFARSEMSPEFAEQMNWLLDSWYEDIIERIATARKLEPETVRTLIDGAPWDAPAALANGLVDGIAYEDELPMILGNAEKPVSLQPYTHVQKFLLRKPRQSAPQTVGVINMQGTIMPGESQSQPIALPVLGKQTLGSSTAQQQIRTARKDESIAAVVLYVDSPGGSALASDLIWRELQLLQQEKPVVVYMGDVAASGGYYIAMGAQHVVAAPATLTGSIGVIIGKAVTAGTYAKLEANRSVIQRGAHAGLYADDHHWVGSEREKIEESIVYVYDLFKERVAAGRNLPYATLDAVANGRVWTGKQALELKLVDELGDFQCAVEKACVLADLPTDGSTHIQRITTSKQKLLGTPIEAAKGALGVDVMQQVGELAELALTQRWQRLFANERIWLLADGLPDVKA